MGLEGSKGDCWPEPCIAAFWAVCPPLLSCSSYAPPVALAQQQAAGSGAAAGGGQGRGRCNQQVRAGWIVGWWVIAAVVIVMVGLAAICLQLCKLAPLHHADQTYAALP